MLDDGKPGPPLLYPGSPQALDPGEGGAHGPWLLEVHGSRTVNAKPLVLSPVRYDYCEVDLTGAQTVDEFGQRVIQSVRTALRCAVDECGDLARLVLRIRLVGEAPGEGSVAEWQGQLNQLELPLGDATASVDVVIDDTRPRIDLESRSRRKDLTGVLARLLLELESPVAGTSDPAVQKLIARVQASVQQAWQSPTYAVLEGASTVDPAATRTRVSRQAWKLMRKLVEQEASA
jgi:hypothetical protein